MRAVASGRVGGLQRIGSARRYESIWLATIRSIVNRSVTARRPASAHVPPSSDSR